MTPGFTCEDILDSDDDGRVTLLDTLYLLHYEFKGGAKPDAPFRECGNDLTADSLPCTQSNCQ
jgi:hypothetical protein